MTQPTHAVPYTGAQVEEAIQKALEIESISKEAIDALFSATAATEATEQSDD